MVYYGNANAALYHFGNLGHPCPPNYNPADYLIDLVTMNSAGFVRSLARKYKDQSLIFHQVLQIIDEIRHEKDNNNLAIFQLKEYASPWFHQAYVLSKRTLINNLRNPYLLRTQYALTIVLAMLIGTIYWHVGNDLPGVQNRAGSLFFIISLLSFASMSSIDIFFQERGLFVRERANGMYRSSSYFLAKTLCDVIPMRVIPPIILGCISYYMIGLHPSQQPFLYFLGILVIVNVCASAMCMAISACTPSLSLGNLIAILLLLFYMLFGGFLVNKQTMPKFVQWMKWLSFLNYSFEILMINELDDLSVRIEVEGDTVQVNGRTVLDQFDMKAERFDMDLFVLLGMVGGYLIITYLVLRFAIKEKR